ncbi:hypothetical protein [Thermogemmatispora sp.]|jgi:hypothetical protein|uniref:hypothetical protein n=1 Tax=Thermogemmatispora sp. TaxID=1968838 RepID=UPI0035E3F58D
MLHLRTRAQEDDSRRRCTRYLLQYAIVLLLSASLGVSRSGIEDRERTSTAFHERATASAESPASLAPTRWQRAI